MAKRVRRTSSPSAPYFRDAKASFSAGVRHRSRHRGTKATSSSDWNSPSSSSSAARACSTVADVGPSRSSESETPSGIEGHPPR